MLIRAVALIFRPFSLTVGAAALLIGCDGRPSSAGQGDTPGAVPGVTADPLGIALTVADSALRSHLKDLSPRLSGPITHVFSPRGEEHSEVMLGKPIGELAERAFAPLFGNAMTDADDIFAVGWFPLAPNHELYVLRTPSQYDPSALTLWAYDLRKRVWSQPLEIADRFGDAGWRFRKEAWIVPSPDGTDVAVVVHRLDEDDDIDSDHPVPKLGPDSLYQYSLRTWLARGFYRTMLPLSRAKEFPLRQDP